MFVLKMLPSEKKYIENQLAPWRSAEAPGKKRILADSRQFMIKCALLQNISFNFGF